MPFQQLHIPSPLFPNIIFMSPRSRLNQEPYIHFENEETTLGQTLYIHFRFGRFGIFICFGSIDSVRSVRRFHGEFFRLGSQRLGSIRFGSYGSGSYGSTVRLLTVEIFGKGIDPCQFHSIYLLNGNLDLRGPLLKSSFAIQCHQGWIQRCTCRKRTTVERLTPCSYGVYLMSLGYIIIYSGPICFLVETVYTK